MLKTNKKVIKRRNRKNKNTLLQLRGLLTKAKFGALKWDQARKWRPRGKAAIGIIAMPLLLPKLNKGIFKVDFKTPILPI